MPQIVEIGAGGILRISRHAQALARSRHFLQGISIVELNRLPRQPLDDDAVRIAVKSASINFPELLMMQAPCLDPQRYLRGRHSRTGRMKPNLSVCGAGKVPVQAALAVCALQRGCWDRQRSVPHASRPRSLSRPDVRLC